MSGETRRGRSRRGDGPSRRAVLARVAGGALAAGSAGVAAPTPAAAQSADGWAMRRADAANSGAVDGAAPESVIERWSYETGTTVRSSPVLAGGTAYLCGEDGTVHAVEVQSGDRAWQTQVGGDVVTSPAAVGERVYVTGTDGVVRALEAASGEQRWAVGLDRGVEASPTVVDGTVFVGGNDGRVRALAAETGEERWVASVDGGVTGAPAVADGTVYAATAAGGVAALDAGSGTAEWEADLFREVRAPPAVGDGVVYLATAGDRLFALEAASGEQRWTYDVSTAVRVPLVVTDDALLVGSADDRVHSLDPATGSQRYEFDAGVGAGALAGFRSAFCVATGSRVRLVGTGSARVRWSVDLTGGVSPSLSVADGQVCLVTNDGTVVLLAPESRSTPTPSATTTGAPAPGTDVTDTPSGRRPTPTPTTDVGVTDREPPGGAGPALPGLTGTVLASLGGLAGIAVVAAYLRRRGSGDGGGGTVTPAEPTPSPVPTPGRDEGGIAATLGEAEDDVNEAVAAFVDGERVVARVRFRQAVSRFDDALERVSGDDGLGVEVTAAATGVPTDLGSVPGLDPDAVGGLRANGYGTLDDVAAASVDELVAEAGLDENTAKLVLVASLGSRDGPRRFETVADVEARRDAAALGRRLCGRGG